MSEGRDWIELRIGITDKEAIRFLVELAEDEELRERLERNPREVLLERNIDLLPGSAPDTVKLPSPKTIAHFADWLDSANPFGNGGGNGHMPHGYVVLYVVHGNGVPPPPPPSDAA